MKNTLKKLLPKPYFKMEKESLAQVFGLSLIVYSLLILSILLIVFVRYQKNNEEERIFSDGFTLVNLLTQFASSNFQVDKRMDLLRVIDFVKREKGLYYCIIMDNEGQPLSHIGKGFSEKHAVDQIIDNAIHSDYPLKQIYKDPNLKKTIHEFSKPVFVDGQKVGVVRLGIVPNTTFIFSKIAFNSLSFALIVIFLLVPFFYYMFRKSLRPFKVLQKKLERVVKNDELKEFTFPSTGEAGEIADKVKETLSHFNTKFNSVNDVKEDLEISNRVIAYEKSRIEAILDHINDGVLAINSSDQIIYANKNIENILNVSRHQLIGNEVDRCVQYEPLRTFIKESRKEGKGFEPKKQPAFVHSISGKGTFQFSFAPLHNSDGNSLGELLVIKDITTQAMAEQARSEFLSHVAHEIRSPLNTIKSYTELLMEGDVEDQETQKEFYNVITMETDRLSKLVEDLLNISKIEMGSLTLKKGMVKPLNLIENCIAVVMSQAVHKHIQVEKLLPENLTALDIDKDLIEVALLNIINNSIKYTPEGGKIIIQAEEESDRTLFHIKDTGSGINQEDLPHIFDKFYRSSNENVQKQKGTGLGLSLTKEIVSLHGGEVKVESTMREGCCFTIALPKETNFERMF